jgi:hypothetical protein
VSRLLDSEAPVGPDRPSTAGSLRYTAVYLAVLLLASWLAFSFGGVRFDKVLAEWPLWFLGCQFLGVGGIIYACGWPRTLTSRCCFGLINMSAVGIVILQTVNLLEYAVVRVIELMLRVSVLGMWSVFVVGLPFVVWGIRCRRQNAKRGSFVVAKYWFSVTLTLGLLEPTAAILDYRETQENPSKLLRFPSRLQDAPEHQIRVAAIGGSTMKGAPYEPKFGIPPVVAWRLRHLFPEREVIVENLARNGRNLRQAVNCLEGLKYRPHLLLVYSGHNEFFHELEEMKQPSNARFHRLDSWLEWSPAFRIANRRLSHRMEFRDFYALEDRRRFERHVATRPVYLRRLQRYRNQLTQLAQFCRAEQISTLWFVPVGSETELNPNRTILPENISTDQRNGIRRRLDRAQSLQEAGDWFSAAQTCRQGLELVPSGAEFHFGLAESLAHLGRHVEAKPHFQVALEEDGWPVRANHDYRQTVGEVAAEFEIPLIDTDAVLRPYSEHGLLDSTLFIDGVHPSLRGFYLLGNAAVEELQTSGMLEALFGTAAETEPPDFATALADAGFTAGDLAGAYRSVALGFRLLNQWRYSGTRRSRQAERFEQWAERLASGDIQPGEAGIEAFVWEQPR